MLQNQSPGSQCGSAAQHPSLLSSAAFPVCKDKTDGTRGAGGGGPCSRALKEAGDFRVGDGVKRREQCVQTDAQLILRVCVRMVGGAGTAAGRASGVEELFRGGQPRKLRAKPGWMSP